MAIKFGFVKVAKSCTSFFTPVGLFPLPGSLELTAMTIRTGIVIVGCATRPVYFFHVFDRLVFIVFVYRLLFILSDRIDFCRFVYTCNIYQMYLSFTIIYLISFCLMGTDLI